MALDLLREERVLLEKPISMRAYLKKKAHEFLAGIACKFCGEKRWDLAIESIFDGRGKQWWTLTCLSCKAQARAWHTDLWDIKAIAVNLTHHLVPLEKRVAFRLMDKEDGCC